MCWRLRYTGEGKGGTSSIRSHMNVHYQLSYGKSGGRVRGLGESDMFGQARHKGNSSLMLFHNCPPTTIHPPNPSCFVPLQRLNLSLPVGEHWYPSRSCPPPHAHTAPSSPDPHPPAPATSPSASQCASSTPASLYTWVPTDP